MVITIICVVLVIAWIVWWIIQEDIWLAVVGGIAFGFFTFLFSVLFCALGCGVPDTEYNFNNNEAEYSIVAMQDNTFIYRRSGEHLTYVYAYEEQNGIRTGEIRADYATILYTKEEPKIVKQSGTFNQWYHWIYAFPTKNHYLIYVPEGTIKSQFNIDLQ